MNDDYGCKACKLIELILYHSIIQLLHVLYIIIITQVFIFAYNSVYNVIAFHKSSVIVKFENLDLQQNVCLHSIIKHGKHNYFCTAEGKYTN